jgi:adenylate cyclase
MTGRTSGSADEGVSADGRRLPGLVARVAAAGALPGDSEDDRLRKGVLALLPALVAPLSVVWVSTYLAVGRPLSAALPLAYMMVSVIGLIVLFRSKRYRVFRVSQLVMILVLPFLLQWSLGGFVASSGVMLWALTAPLGALLFYGTRQAVPWLLAYLALTGVTGLLDGRLAENPAPIPDPVVVAFFVLNIAAVSGVSFFLLLYFVRERERAQARSERLLLNVLPKPIADRLKTSEAIIADGFEEATVLFADIVDFTPLSDHMRPDEVVRLLDEVFSAFDRLAEKHGLEKIKTIGDAYMVAGGLPAPRSDHTEAVANMALDMQEVTAHLDHDLSVRIGMDTGPVVAGVIGRRKFIYDLWGDTVNTASRMESHGLPGRIQVTERVYERLRDRFDFEARGPQEVKGKGTMRPFFLLGRRG